jgi:NAD(P)-dependent dehydrogenase (short-subunit alcohol dehydrogenase family)
MSTLEGKTAFVSGGANGLGLAYAKALATEGVNIALADIQLAPLLQARDTIEKMGVRVIALPLDVSEQSALRLAAQQVEATFGKVHFVVNVPGVCITKPLLELTVLDWQWLFNVNVFHLINSTEAFLPALRRHGESGRILNMISLSSLLTVGETQGMAAYGVTKHAALAYTEALREALKGSKIGVTALFPYKTNTEMYASWKVRQDRFGVITEQTRPDYRGFDAYLADGRPPEQSGQAVIEAINEDIFYMFCMDAARELFLQRNADILAGIDRATLHKPRAKNSS